MNRRAALSLPPPMADTSALGREQDLLGLSDEPTIHYLDHGSRSRLIRWHYHPAYELHLIVATEGTAYVGDYTGRFAPYTLMLTGPNVPHNWVTDDTCEPVALRDRVILFSEAFVRRCIEFFPSARHVRSLLLEEARHGIAFSSELGRQLEPHFRRVSDHGGLRRVASFFEMVEALAEDDTRKPLSSRPFQAASDPAQSVRLHRAVTYIERHYAGDISLKAVADRLDMSESAFSRFFHQHTGYRFIDYVNQTRVQHACERLSGSDAPITDICYDVGFSNLSNFNRRFLILTGMTPREYRMRHRGPAPQT
ncbi:AraC family transcriptional regulator [Luteibacter anthropi]|uniref:Helix-turn-helix transcriptional regulator n=1 Tax=Luteibacter anthropi TaxID=564369 RepID=A0A7X5UCY9_9GAMM|nr:AraC family transcriptional regulator [Luteibacter anthropi]NII07997.1 helix-turn-helix transcriptional regulator [Luteibacter anthropi]URX63534.1 AraC family transcriptional regulator [Luteibacter anthropi]